MSEQEDDGETHQKDKQDVTTIDIINKKILLPSPKTRMIEMMEEEREE